jgi:hypothetical protein
MVDVLFGVIGVPFSALERGIIGPIGFFLLYSYK